jgi:large subunit ribosomal protein L31
MKSGIHPNYSYTTVKCISCSTEFTIGSVREIGSVEVCAKCHPFYTGKRTLVDTAGRVEKFRAKLEKKEQLSNK